MLAGSLHRGTRINSWQRFDVRRIEDLANAVLGADLDVVQMPGPRVRGSLAFAACRGVLFSSGLIEGHVSLSGPLCRDAITRGIGLRFGPNSWLGLTPVRNGHIGVVLPGDRNEAWLSAGSLYVTATLSAQRLEEEAERVGLVFNRRMTSRTGLHPQPIAPPSLVSLTRQVASIHSGSTATNDDANAEVGFKVLHTVIGRYACATTVGGGRIRPAPHAAIVYRARRYIGEHLAEPITLDRIAGAVSTSPRTLARAFVEVLGDTPGDYVRRLRLHRIRRDLVAERQGTRAIATIAARWGLPEPGRMSRWYGELFGELPGDTQVVALARWRLTDELL
jgi:AraC-like DNA-binding protein